MPPTKKYKPVDPYAKENFGLSSSIQARAFRLMIRHGLYAIHASQPMVGLGGGRRENATGKTWPEAVFNLCDLVGLTETNHLSDCE